MNAEIRWRDPGPGTAVWAELAAPAHPPLAARNPNAVAWRGLLVDPDLFGLVPGRSSPDRVDIVHHGRRWRLPLPGVLATPLAWHPCYPLVAGLAVRHRRAYPWVADYRARTVTLHDEVRVATALTDHGGTPVEWCGDRHLALLAAPPSPTADSPPEDGTAVFEATGPAYVSFLPGVELLEELAAAPVATLDVTDSSVVTRTPPLLCYTLRLDETGAALGAEHAAEDTSGTGGDGLRRVHTTTPPLHLASSAFLAARRDRRAGRTGPMEHVEGPRALPRRPSRRLPHAHARAHLTWDDPPDGRTGPVLLWLRATDRPEPPAEFSSSLPVWASAGTTQLELRLHWPPDATVELLHDQIVDPVRTAISLLSEPSGRPVVVGGHSFGATLALYALAHLPEPVAAIAHSGCYNRTLVPTGFQNEQRQYWDAPELYQAFSAQHFADRLDRPVLLVHGSEDLNPATPPEQAVGLYRAIVARGGHARLVLFAGEGHNFHFRETLTTLAAEHRDWLSRCDPGRRATP